MAVFNLILEWIVALLTILGVVLLFRAQALRPLLVNGTNAVTKKKYLWLIGIFGGLAAYGGEVNFLSQKISSVANFSGYIEAIRDAVSSGQADQLLTLLKRGFSTLPWNITAYILLALLLVAVVYWLTVISQGVIIRMTGRMAANEPSSFIDAMAMASTKFWDLVKVSIIFVLIGWGIWLVLSGIPTMIFFITNSHAWANVAQIGSYASVVVSFVNLFVVQYAFTYILLQNTRAIDSIVRAWRLFRKNIFITVELALALFAVNLLVSIIISSLLTFFFPTVTPASFYTTLVVIIIELGVMAAFSYGATTSLFVQLQKASPESKLGQWTERIVNLASAKKPA